jgi:hypothetical protein
MFSPEKTVPVRPRTVFFPFLDVGSIKKRREFVQQGNDLCRLLPEMAVAQTGRSSGKGVARWISDCNWPDEKVICAAL